MLRERLRKPSNAEAAAPAVLQMKQDDPGRSLNSDQQELMNVQQRSGNTAAQRLIGTLQRDEAVATPEQTEQRERLDYQPDEKAGGAPTERSSARFENDPTMAEIDAGKRVLKWGDRGLAVTKMQQGLQDMGYMLKQFGVDGIFKNETKKGLVKFQEDNGLAPATGEFDKATSDVFRTKFASRQPYIDNAQFDPANPKKGVRNLSADDRKNTWEAMEAKGKAGAKFEDEVGGKKYADEIRDALNVIIPKFHKELYEDKAPLREKNGKPTEENLHEWSTIEGAAGAAKDVTDKLYGSYTPQAKNLKLTHAGGNLNDQWEEESKAQAKNTEPELAGKANDLVIYLIQNNCTGVNKRHSANPSAAQERTLLAPVIASFVDSKAKIKILNEIDIGWEGTQGGGSINLQRYKSNDQEKNRVAMWDIFHTSIHEYLHLLKHPDYESYADALYAAGEKNRYNTLIEGFCDFFTENVRPTVTVTPQLRQQVEGPYFDANVPAPTVKPPTYPSKAEAEQVVSIVGIRNAQEAYFHGDVTKVGGPPKGKKFDPNKPF